MIEEATHEVQIDDIVPLGDFVLDENAWDAIDGDFLQELLLEDAHADGGTLGQPSDHEVPTVSSEAAGSKSRGSTDVSGHHDDGSAPRSKRARAEDSAEEKLEKLRNRNRLAQARRRQRQREELEILEKQVSDARDKIQESQGTSRLQREEKAQLIERIAQADQAIASTAQEAARTAPHVASFPPDSSSMLRVITTFQNIPGANKPKRQRPIDSFQAHCPLFVESCVADMTKRSPNLSFTSFSDTLAHHKSSLAMQTGVPASEVCWFLQTIYSAPSGEPLSINSSLSTVRCNIAVLFTFMLTQLETALVDKELDCYNGSVAEEAGSGNMFPYVMSISPVPDQDACTLLESPLLDTAQWSRGITLSCGVNSSADMCATIHHVVCTLLRQHRDNMPRAAWLRRCRDFLRKLEIMVGRKRSDGSLGRPVPKGGPKGGYQSNTVQDMNGDDDGISQMLNTGKQGSESFFEGPGDGSRGSGQSAETAGGWTVARQGCRSLGGSGGESAAPSQGGNIGAPTAGEVAQCCGEGIPVPSDTAAAQHSTAQATQPISDDLIDCGMTGIPKFEGKHLRVALVVQCMAHAIGTCMEESPQLGQVWAPSEARKQQLLERATLVSSTWMYTWCAVLHDAPFSARDISVDVCGPGLSTLEWMEETHSQLFKRIKFTSEQRTCIAAMWRDWQKHRRALDSQLQTACGHVAALPDTDEISDAFVALVSSKCMEVPRMPHAQTAEMACRLQPRSLLGLCPVATSAAQSAVQALFEVQDRDARLQVDVMAMFITPWFWSSAQAIKALASLTSHNVKLDHLMLWQIACMQARRYDLFVTRAIENNAVMV